MGNRTAAGQSWTTHNIGKRILFGGVYPSFVSDSGLRFLRSYNAQPSLSKYNHSGGSGVSSDQFNEATRGGSWHNGKNDCVSWSSNRVYYKGVESSVLATSTDSAEKFIEKATLVKLTATQAAALGQTPGATIIVAVICSIDIAEPVVANRVYSFSLVILNKFVTTIRTSTLVGVSAVRGYTSGVSVVGDFIVFASMPYNGVQEVKKATLTANLSISAISTLYSGVVKAVTVVIDGSSTESPPGTVNTNRTYSGSIQAGPHPVVMLSAEMDGLYALCMDVVALTVTGSYSSAIVLETNTGSSNLTFNIDYDSKFLVKKLVLDVLEPYWEPQEIYPFSHTVIESSSTDSGPYIFTSSDVQSRHDMFAAVFSGKDKIIVLNGRSASYSATEYYEGDTGTRDYTSQQTRYMSISSNTGENLVSGDTGSFASTTPSGGTSTYVVPSIGTSVLNLVFQNAHDSPPFSIAPGMVLGAGALYEDTNIPVLFKEYTFKLDIPAGLTVTSEFAVNKVGAGYKSISLTDK